MELECLSRISRHGMRSRAVGGLSEWRIHSGANQTRGDFTASYVVADPTSRIMNFRTMDAGLLSKDAVRTLLRPSKSPQHSTDMDSSL